MYVIVVMRVSHRHGERRWCTTCRKILSLWHRITGISIDDHMDGDNFVCRNNKGNQMETIWICREG